MLSQPKTEERTPVGWRWAKRALRFLIGLLLLTAIGGSASHFHVGDLTNPAHCALCQVVGMELDSKTDVPEPPFQGDVWETWVLPHPATHATTPTVPDLLPRGPPLFA